MATVHDVAAHIMARQGAMSAMKLQKLCYYAQAWSLVWDEAELFPEEIQAWANGPVIRELYDQHRGQYTVTTWPYGDPSALTVDQRASIDAVLDAYGSLTAQQLSDLTHQERPWLDARGTLPPTTRSNARITPIAMQNFYASLVNNDEAEDV